MFTSYYTKHLFVFIVDDVLWRKSRTLTCAPFYRPPLPPQESHGVHPDILTLMKHETVLGRRTLEKTFFQPENVKLLVIVSSHCIHLSLSRTFAIVVKCYQYFPLFKRNLPIADNSVGWFSLRQLLLSIG